MSLYCFQGNYPVAKHYLQLIDSAIKTHLQDDKELPLKWLWSVTEMRLRQATEDPSPRCIEAIIAVLKQFAALAETNELLTSSPAVAWQHHLLHARALHYVGDVMLDLTTGEYCIITVLLVFFLLLLLVIIMMAHTYYNHYIVAKFINQSTAGCFDPRVSVNC